MINNVDDAKDTSNKEKKRLDSKSNLNKKFNLIIVGPTKRSPGIRIRQ